ncbi:MAG TPA: ATP synthase F0 subunit C, partial [Edaphobacter sp.]|nr:ATP synthase F0 subunit C [Edaphobacter sp.]
FAGAFFGSTSAESLITIITGPGAAADAAGAGVAAGLCGLGQGKATASATEALARNPGARPGIFIFLILGLAFIESLALFTFVIIFLKVKA